MNDQANKSGRNKFIALIAVLVFSFFLIRWTPLGQYFVKERLLAFFASLKGHWWGPVVFILIYGAGCVFAFPGSVLTLSGGAIFGVFLGTIYNFTGACLGASLSFFMARHLGREFVSGFLKGGKLSQLDAGIEKNGLKTIFRLRLIPVLPFNALNFASGLSKIKYRDYILGTMGGILPGSFIYTYFASALLGGVQGAGRKAILNLIAASALLIFVSFLPAIIKKLKPAAN